MNGKSMSKLNAGGRARARSEPSCDSSRRSSRQSGKSLHLSPGASARNQNTLSPQSLTVEFKNLNISPCDESKNVEEGINAFCKALGDYEISSKHSNQEKEGPITEIGMGTFARILVHSRFSNIAWKMNSDKEGRHTRASIRHEKDFFESLPPHRNIISYLGYADLILSSGIKRNVLALSHCNIDLYEYLNKKTQSAHDIREKPVREIILGVAEGLSYLHSKEYLHRDIKTENTLLDFQGDRIIAKICDFGFAVKFGQEKTVFGSTFEIISPEILCSGAPFDIKTELWAFGTLIMDTILYPLYPPYFCTKNNEKKILKTMPQDEFTKALGKIKLKTYRTSLKSVLEKKYTSFEQFMGKPLNPLGSELNTLPWKMQLMVCGAAFRRWNPDNRMPLDHFISLEKAMLPGDSPTPS